MPVMSRPTISADSGSIAEMNARSGPGLNDPFEEAIDGALSSLPADLRAAMSNVEISTYSGVLPDKISIFGWADHPTRCPRHRSATPRGQAPRAP
jgi:hypothetical protein